MLFHHDPLHADDFLDVLHAHAQERWAGGGGEARDVLAAMEGMEVEVAGSRDDAVLQPAAPAPGASAQL